MFKKYFSLNKLSTLLLYTSIFIFIIAFNFSDNRSGAWQQQFLPNVNGASLQDITFLDSLTGFAVTGSPGYVLKTTNGGDNWSINYSHNDVLVTIQFINQDTGYSLSFQQFLRTYNQGDSWEVINLPSNITALDMFVLNSDTMWAADGIPSFGGLYRTTNGGMNWTLQFNTVGSGNPDKVYFFNKDIGFITHDGDNLWKSTNSGISWNEIIGASGFSDIYFKDNLTGWKCNEDIQRTSNGGINWKTLPLPPKGTPTIYNGEILLSRIRKFSNVNKDTIWGVGSEAFFGAGRSRGLIYKTTDQGNSWGYQMPDTSIDIFNYSYCELVNKQNVWCYKIRDNGVHTVKGGDSVTIYTKINNNYVNIHENFILYQNYPNPFNPNTVISYELRSTGNVKLKIYDINGKEVTTFVNQKQKSGTHQIEFNGNALSSGIYFYSLLVDGQLLGTKKMVLVR